MKAFELHHPTTVEAAGRLLAEGHSKAMGGGIDLLDELKDYIATPDRVVDLKHIPGLDSISFDTHKGLHVGALVRLVEVSSFDVVRQHYAALGEAAESVGTPQIRNVGTIGGNLCQRPRCWYYRKESLHCLKKGGSTCYAGAENGQNKYHAILGGGPCYIVHPSDTAPALIALQAQVQTGGRKARLLDVEHFFTLPSEARVTQENTLEPGEIVTGVQLPPPAPNSRSIYVKLREKDSMDWTLVSVALAVTMDGSHVREARVVLGGVAPVPWRARAAEQAMRGAALTDAARMTHAAESATMGAQPLPHNGYKVQLVQAVFREAVAMLAGGPRTAFKEGCYVG